MQVTALTPSPMLGVPDTATELMASVAGGDSAPLAGIQTTHQTDLALSSLAGADRGSLLRLADGCTTADPLCSA